MVGWRIPFGGGSAWGLGSEAQDLGFAGLRSQAFRLEPRLYLSEAFKAIPPRPPHILAARA